MAREESLRIEAEEQEGAVWEGVLPQAPARRRMPEGTVSLSKDHIACFSAVRKIKPFPKPGYYCAGMWASDFLVVDFNAFVGEHGR